MTKKFIKKLAVDSYEGNHILNTEIVNTIAQRLTRAQLKKYINALSEIENKSTVLVKSSTNLPVDTQKSLESLYKDKKVLYETDPSLLLGTEIVDYDIVYNRSLKNTFKDLITHVESYDN